MKRFRFTLLAACLVLLYLGAMDIRLFLQNRAPATVDIATLEQQGPPRAWVRATDGFFDLERAISTSGTLQLEALLVPVTSSPGVRDFRVLAETRDPQLVDLFRKYHFGFDSAYEQQQFLQEHREEFHPRRQLQGMVISGLIASGNRDKLMKLARQVGMAVPEDVLFISEGKEPPKYRGFFFAVIGLLGALRILTRWRTSRPAPAGQDDLTILPPE